jgi:DNA primase
VEDALSLVVAGYSSVVATLGVGAIGRAHIPHGFRRVIVVRDGDRPGSEADHARSITVWSGSAIRACQSG